MLDCNCCRALPLLLFLCCASVCALTCTKDPASTCRCSLEDGRVFDLSKAASSDPNKPRYVKSVAVGTSTETYSYNPCKAFSCGDTSGFTAAVCDAISSAQYYAITGTQDSVTFRFQGDKLQAVYSKDSATATITFTCSDESGYGTFTASSDGSINVDGSLSSQYACFSSSSSSSASSGLSLGDVLLIIFFTALAVYFIAGILFQALVRKQRGVDMLPNRAFWTGLPANVRDGVKFSIAKVKSRSSEYSNI